jgi:hypothetical protein
MMTFEGFMIPGLYLENGYGIWVYCWKDSSIQIKHMSEVWIVEPNNRKICYIDPQEGIPLFNVYHTFDEVLDAEIHVEEKNKTITIHVSKNGYVILHVNIDTKMTLENRIINLILSTKIKKGISLKGKTETGKTFINFPNKIMKIDHANVYYKGNNLGDIIKPRKIIAFGDGKISKKPIVNYCKHALEE